MKRLLMLQVFGVFAWLLSGCGVALPTPTPIEEMSLDLAEPSGQVNAESVGKAFTLHAQGKLALRMSGTSKYGKIPSFLKTPTEQQTSQPAGMEASLSRAGFPREVASVLAPFLSLGLARGTKTHKVGSLGVSKQAYLGDFWGKISESVKLGLCVKGDAPKFGGPGVVELQLDMRCLKKAASGKITLRSTEKFVAGVPRVFFEVEFHEVCAREGGCVEGKLLYTFVNERHKNFPFRTYRGLLMSMHLVSRSQEGKEIRIKQGITFMVESTTSDQVGQPFGDISILHYLPNEQGEDVTVLMAVKAGSDLSSFTMQGKNGRFLCTTKDNGVTGSCTKDRGDESFSWSK